MLNSIRNGFQGFWKYALGRGLITSAVILSTTVAASAGWSLLVPAAVAGGSVLWNGLKRVLEQRTYQQNMLEFYKDEVAAATGKEIDSLTVSDLKSAAYGDPRKDIPRNEVLAYALDRQKAKSWLTLGTAMAAGLVTFGLLLTPMPDMLSAAFGDLSFGNTLGNFSTGIVAGLSSLIVHNGLDRVIGNSTGINNLAAHDRIMLIERTQKRGKTIEPTQVLDVFISANPNLNARINAKYGERYQGMNRREKQTVMNDLGVGQLMGRLAEGLGNKAIDATELAFIANGAEPLSVRGKASIAGTERAAERVETNHPTQSNFADRVGGSKRSQQSFTERVDASRAQAHATAIA